MLRGSAGFIASRLEELSAGARTSAKTSRVVRVGVNAAAALTSTATRRERRVKAIITSDYGKERGVSSTAWRARTKTLECPSQRQGHRERAVKLPVPLYIAYQGMNLTAKSKIALERGPRSGGAKFAPQNAHPVTMFRTRASVSGK